MKLFYLTHGPQGDASVSTEGEDRTTSEKLLSDMGLTFDFVDEQTYTIFVSQNRPSKNDAPDVVQAKSNFKNPVSTTDDKFNALVKILGL